MNLKNVDDYMIGLDIGTTSVGWAVLGMDGNLCKFAGKNTWGSRIFEEAETAAKTRTFRTLRRRYGRRRSRLLELRTILSDEINRVDPGFFARLDQSMLLSEDRDFSEQYVLFNDLGFDEKEYYTQFKTIYHLRKYLLETADQADIRLIYLAFHHMLKYRGNFLLEGEGISAANADARPAIASFLAAMSNFAEQKDFDYDISFIDADTLNEIITSSTKSRAEKREAFEKYLALPTELNKTAKVISQIVFGYKSEFATVFEVEQSADTKFSLSDDEKVEAFSGLLVSDIELELFESFKSLYNAYLLANILKGNAGGTLSHSMCAKYEQHKADLKELKGLVKRVCPEKYNEVFRGSTYKGESSAVYLKGDALGYTAYILNTGKGNHLEIFYDYLKKLFKDAAMSEEDAALWSNICLRMEDGSYMPKLRTFENGAIPHQFHLEEMHAIIQRQKAFYPVLSSRGEDIEKLLSFRLPYYVGPLGKNKNPQRKKAFAWAVRKEGQEGVAVKPWNFEDVIDTDACAEAFITNLTGECTYYYGKKAIPKHSLLYEEFCVRQELNVCRSVDGDDYSSRLDWETCEAIIEGVFKQRKRVKTSDVIAFLQRNYPAACYRSLDGTQKENEFASCLGSYNDFRKILNRSIESYEDIQMVEQLISWVTIFEDKKILQRKVLQAYGPDGSGSLTHEQVKAVCKLRYTGWSRLSKEFLTELRAEYQGSRLSIMDVLRNPRNLRSGNACMNLMEILAHEQLGFQKILDDKNKLYMQEHATAAIEDIPGSPAIKRGINQSLRIVDEIISIAGHAPKKIIVEMAREEVGKGKGSRTKTREKALLESYDAFRKDLQSGADDFDEKHELAKSKDHLDDERLYLYMLQRGKCMYCGKRIELELPGSNHVDHILPQSFIKDDSIENKVLVHYGCNERKLDEYPLPQQVRTANFYRWRALYEAGLIGKKKFDNLTCSEIRQKQFIGFINRQLVETRQISKHVVNLLGSKYPESTIETIKAELTHGLREDYGFYKLRELNDYHHAHDAYLACQMSRFLSLRYPCFAKDLDYSSYRRLSAAEKGSKRGHNGLFVWQFGKNGNERAADKTDSWDADFELGRIRKCLAYKDCIVTRKLERLTGEFWNQTVYSSRIPSEKTIRLKKDLEPSKYGYYQSPNSAYYALIEYDGQVRAKKKRVVELVGIPVNASYRIHGDEDLLVYLQDQFENVRILKAPILKYQKISWDGAEYYLTSHSELINARQLCLPGRFVKLLAEVQKTDSKAIFGEIPCALDELYEYLCEQIDIYYPRYKGLVEKLTTKGKSDFLSCASNDKLSAILSLLRMLHCNATYGVKELGLLRAGRMDKVQTIGASISKIEFIDSSVTGLHERHYKIELDS